jgi:hypothetical protein
VVKHQRLGASGDRAFMAGDDRPARADLDKVASKRTFTVHPASRAGTEE